MEIETVISDRVRKRARSLCLGVFSSPRSRRVVTAWVTTSSVWCRLWDHSHPLGEAKVSNIPYRRQQLQHRQTAILLTLTHRVSGPSTSLNQRRRLNIKSPIQERMPPKGGGLRKKTTAIWPKRVVRKTSENSVHQEVNVEDIHKESSSHILKVSKYQG